LGLGNQRRQRTGGKRSGYEAHSVILPRQRPSL
jgi:hypothetical protein